jgi:hypothetical protein
MFRLPNFNLFADFWLFANLPFLGPPDITNIPVQLWVNNREFDFGDQTTLFLAAQTVQIRTDKSFWNNIGSQTNGSVWGITDSFHHVWYYYQVWWENIHMGFPNEYTQIIAQQCDDHGKVPDPSR